MNNSNVIMMNGRLIPAEEATVSAFDPGFLYGETVFTTIGVRNSTAIFLKRHLRRLLHMASVLRMHSLPHPDQIQNGVETLLASLFPQPSLLRITITPGPLSGYKLDQESQGPSSWLITPIFRPLPDPSLYKNGVSTEISTIPALSFRDPRSSLKTGNLLLSRWLRKNKPPSRFELLMKNAQGLLLEGTVSNLFFLLQDKTVLTPPEQWGILPGVIRSALIDILNRRRIPLRWGSLTSRTLHRANGAFLTNSFIGILPVQTIFAPRHVSLEQEELSTEPLWKSGEEQDLLPVLVSDLHRLEEEERIG
ncbi:MAG: aminotransferase class IV [Leptospirales bacterium]